MAAPIPEVIQNPTSASLTKFWIGVPKADFKEEDWLKVPLMDEVEFTPQDSTDTLTTFEEMYDYVVRTGMGGTLNFQTAGNAKDEGAIRTLHEVTYDPEGNTVFFYRIQYPDGTYRYGNFNATRPRPVTAARGIFKYRVEGQLTGPQGFQAGDGEGEGEGES